MSLDDSLWKRITQSYAKYTSNESGSFMYGSDQVRFDAVQTLRRRNISWQSMLLNPDMVLPQNVKGHLIFTINPSIHTVLDSPAFSAKTDAAADGVLRFYSIHMVNTYVKVENDTPMEVFVPAYSIKSSYQLITSTSNNLQFTVDKDVYKLACMLQSTVVPVRTGGVHTKFTSGLLHNDQSSQSGRLTGLQLTFAGQNYPASMYTIQEDTNITKSMEPYLDFLGACSAQQDPSGGEPYSVWSDPKIISDTAFGRIFLFNIVLPPNNAATTVEVTAIFAPAPATTRLILSSISKSIYQIKYNAQRQVESVSVATYN